MSAPINSQKCFVAYPEAGSSQLLTQSNSPVPGYFAMLISNYGHEYPESAVHDDHEGFYVVNGNGKMLIGKQEYDISTGCTMVVPAGTPHAIRKTDDACLTVFVFHFSK